MTAMTTTSTPNPQWPELMSLTTVADYCDLSGAGSQRATALRAERFCKSMGITVLDIPGIKCKKVRRKDIDAKLMIGQE